MAAVVDGAVPPWHRVADVVDTVACYAPDAGTLLAMRGACSLWLGSCRGRILDALEADAKDAVHRALDEVEHNPLDCGGTRRTLPYGGPCLRCPRHESQGLRLPALSRFGTAEERSTLAAVLLLSPVRAPDASECNDDERGDFGVMLCAVDATPSRPCHACGNVRLVLRSRLQTSGTSRLAALAGWLPDPPTPASVAQLLAAAPRLKSLSLSDTDDVTAELVAAVAMEQPFLRALTLTVPESEVTVAMADSLASLRGLEHLHLTFDVPPPPQPPAEAASSTAVAVSAIAARVLFGPPQLRSLALRNVTVDEWNAAVTSAPGSGSGSTVRTLSVQCVGPRGRAPRGPLRLPPSAFPVLRDLHAAPAGVACHTLLRPICAQIQAGLLEIASDGIRSLSVDSSDPELRFVSSYGSLDCLAVTNVAPERETDDGKARVAALTSVADCDVEGCLPSPSAWGALEVLNAVDVDAEIAASLVSGATPLPRLRHLEIATLTAIPSTVHAIGASWHNVETLSLVDLSRAAECERQAVSLSPLSSATRLRALTVNQCDCITALDFNPAGLFELRELQIHDQPLLLDSETSWQTITGLPRLEQLRCELSYASVQAALAVLNGDDAASKARRFRGNLRMLSVAGRGVEMPPARDFAALIGPCANIQSLEVGAWYDARGRLLNMSNVAGGGFLQLVAAAPVAASLRELKIGLGQFSPTPLIACRHAVSVASAKKHLSHMPQLRTLSLPLSRLDASHVVRAFSEHKCCPHLNQVYGFKTQRTRVGYSGADRELDQLDEAEEAREKAEGLWEVEPTVDHEAGPRPPPLWDADAAETVVSDGSRWSWERRSATWRRTSSLRQSSFADGRHQYSALSPPSAPPRTPSPPPEATA